MVSAGDEHGQDGHLIEDAETRNEMMRKRMRKMDGIKAEALDPVAHGSSNPEYVLIGFGSTKGAVREAAGLLSQQGHPALAVHLPQVYPLPDKLREIWQLPGQKWIVENNYSGQLQN